MNSRKDFAQKNNDIVNWRIQADEWKNRNKKKDHLANKVLDYVFLKNQDDEEAEQLNDVSSSRKTDSIMATRDNLRNCAEIRKMKQKGTMKEEKPRLFESSLDFICRDNVQDPFQFFDYPIPDELINTLAKSSQNLSPGNELRKFTKSVNRCANTPAIKPSTAAKFKRTYALLQRQREPILRNRCTQTEINQQHEITKKPSTIKKRCPRFIVGGEDRREPVQLQVQQLQNLPTASDIDVIVDKRIFKAHKVMLMAFSQWFHRSLTSLPCSTSRVVLEGVDPNIFDVIYQWMYTYKLNVSLENIASVITLARGLEMPQLLKKLKGAVTRMVVIAGPLAIYDAAERLESTKLAEYATVALNDNITVLGQSDVFFCYTPEEVCDLFCKYPIQAKLTDCFTVLVLWLVHHWDNNMPVMDRILGLIPLDRLTDDELFDLFKIVQDLNVTKTPEYRDAILRAVMNRMNQNIKCSKGNEIDPHDYCSVVRKADVGDTDIDCTRDPKILKEIVAIQQQFHLFKKDETPNEVSVGPVSGLSIQRQREKDSATKIQAAFRGHLVRNACEKDDMLKLTTMSEEEVTSCIKQSYFLLAGGIDPFQELKDDMDEVQGVTIYCYGVNENRWGMLDQLPVPRHHAAAALLHGVIYYTGGSGLFSGDYFEATNNVWCYEPFKARWSTKNSMINSRVYHSLVAVDGLLYAIGGMDKHHQLLKSIECYDPTSEMWSEVARLDHGRMAMSTAVYRKMVVICGGVGEEDSTSLSLLLRSCELFIPQSRKVLKMKSLRIPRCFACMVEVEGKLHLIGGATIETDGKNHVSVISIKDIDVWEEKTSSWEKKSTLRVERQDMVCGLLENRVYIMGGQSSQLNATITTVDCFTHREKKWITGVPGLPRGISGTTCVTLESVARLPIKGCSPRVD